MTTTTLDSFVIELGIDPKQLTAGSREALDSLRKLKEEGLKGANEVEAKQKTALGAILAFRREAMTVLGVFLGGAGFGEAMKYVTNTDIAIGNLSRTMNISKSDINAWGIEFRKLGGTAEEAQGALATTTAALSEAKITGNWNPVNITGKLGVDPRRVKDAEDLWLRVAAGFQEMAKTPEGAVMATGWLQHIPGITPGMTNFILSGRATPGNIANTAAAHPITEEYVKAAHDYNDALVELESSATTLGQTLLVRLAPAFDSVMDAMSNLLHGKTDGSHSWSDAINGFFGWMSDTAHSGPFNKPQPSSTSWAGNLDVGAFGEGGGGSSDEAKIRAYAASIGLNPDEVAWIAKHEGLGRKGTWWDVNGPSGGDFSLHKNPQGNGVGDLYEKQTGNRLGDPAHQWDEDKFAMNYQKAHGFSAWSTFRGSPWANGGGQAPGARFSAAGGVRTAAGAGGAGGNSATVSIDTIHVNNAAVKDAATFSQTVGSQLNRTVNASLFNSGGN
jgi:hypothetical protein